MEIHFILVEPQVPENIGATARAIKTMGFSSLILINPNNHLDIKAKMLAHASNEILEKAKLYNSLADCINDFDFVIASTAKKRNIKQDYIDCEKLPKLISEKGKTIKNIAVVFGREESGLTNEELEMCDITSSIPLQNPYPSLNLSQAVMIYAYTLSKLKISKFDLKSTNPKASELKVLKSKANSIFDEIGISKNKTIHKRILERLMLLGEDDIHLLLSISSKIEAKLK
jgi:tRNA/rRNA methyltransferase